MSIHFETPKTSARVEKYDNRLLFSRWFLGPFMQKKMENSCISKSTTQSLQAQKAKSTSARHCTSIANPYTVYALTWNPKQPDFFMVVSIGWWTKPLQRDRVVSPNIHPFKKWVFFRVPGTWYQVMQESDSEIIFWRPKMRTIIPGANWQAEGERIHKASATYFSLPYPIFPQPFGGLEIPPNGIDRPCPNC